MFLGSISALVLFYGGRRRQGDVAFFCELSIGRREVEEGFKLIVCVLDLGHELNHDISRGADIFWEQVKGGRARVVSHMNL